MHAFHTSNSGSRGQIQVVNFDTRNFYLLSHLACPEFIFWFENLTENYNDHDWQRGTNTGARQIDKVREPKGKIYALTFLVKYVFIFN